MIERAIRFGESASLVGVLTEPPADRGDREAPVHVFLNSGIIHRVGASRLHVTIARRLAREGVTSLRFDFSGIGDSDARRDALPFVKSAVIEIREALDHLERTHGSTHFTLVGLCSGADMAFEAARQDPRVSGLVQFDPYAYRTRGWYLRHYGPRILNPAAWRHSIRVRLNPIGYRLARGGDDAAGAGVFVAPEYRRTFPPRRQVEAGLAELSARGVRFLVCFTGDERNILHRDQYADAFSSVDFQGRLEVEFLPETDHTFTHPDHQAWLAERVARWSREGSGSPGVMGR